jgi:hypothetical protein
MGRSDDEITDATASTISEKLEARWTSDGRQGHLQRGDDLAGRVVIDCWFEPGTREPRTAWVVDFMLSDDTIMQRALVELDAEPARDERRMAELSEAAEEAIRCGPPPTPEPFGMATTGMASAAELRGRIDLVSHALQTAEGRLGDVAQTTESWSADIVVISLTETLAWLRVLDELLCFTWRKFVSGNVREAASTEIDKLIARHGAAAGCMTDAREERERTGAPYADWTTLLIGSGLALSRPELQGLRWLAGKMLHFGPLPATELRQWRAGEEPRWKWRQPDAIFPSDQSEQQAGQRALYAEHLAGNDVVGTLNLTTMLIEMEHRFFKMLRDTEAN